MRKRHNTETQTQTKNETCTEPTGTTEKGKQRIRWWHPNQKGAQSFDHTQKRYIRKLREKEDFTYLSEKVAFPWRMSCLSEHRCCWWWWFWSFATPVARIEHYNVMGFLLPLLEFEVKRWPFGLENLLRFLSNPKEDQKLARNT